MKTILVTGANGQLGNEIKKASNKFSLFNFLFTDVNNLNITDEKELEDFFSINKINFIINCAAYTNVDKAETEKDKAEKINVFAVENLAKLSKKHKAHLIHISTDYVFDGNSKIPYIETDKTNPQSIYGETKLGGENSAKKAYKYIIIRTSWLYSSFGHNFVKTMLRLGTDKKEINIVSDQIGSPTYAKDLALIILKIISKTNKDNNNFIEGIFHFSNEGICSWQEFAAEIMQQKKLKCKVNPISTLEYPTPAKRPKYSLLNKTKIKKTFNIEIRNWESALSECLSLF